MHAADGGKDITRRATELCGVALTITEYVEYNERGKYIVTGGWLTDFHADVKALGDEGQTITSLF